MHKYLLKYRKEYGSFSKYLWAYTNDKIIYEKKKMKQRVRYQIKFLRI